MGISLWVELLISAILFLILSLFLSLYWKVFNLIDEVSGRRAKRQIAKLREYNKSTGEITSVSTAELEMVLEGGGTLVNNTSSSTTSNLRAMIEDPYGSVGRGEIASSKLASKPDDDSTGILLDEEECTVGESETGILSEKKCIIILDEQSSI